MTAAQTSNVLNILVIINIVHKIRANLACSGDEVVYKPNWKNKLKSLVAIENGDLITWKLLRLDRRIKLVQNIEIY